MQASKPKEPSPCDVLSDAELKALSERAIMRAFAKNTVIVSEGDRADSLYIVLSGRVRAYVSDDQRSEEHTSELQSRVDISYAVFCLKKKKKITTRSHHGWLTRTAHQSHLEPRR